MFLLVTPAGGKLWHLKYRIDGREKLLAMGSYPEVSLGDARRRRDAARQLIAAGKDASREKQRAKVRSRVQDSNTFEGIADEFCKKRRRDGQKAWAASTTVRSEYLLSLLMPSVARVGENKAAAGEDIVLKSFDRLIEERQVESGLPPLAFNSKFFDLRVLGPCITSAGPQVHDRQSGVSDRRRNRRYRACSRTGNEVSG